MDDDLVTRLTTIGGDLKNRAAELGQTGQDRDTALLMQGLAVTMEAIRALGAATDRLDGLSGLGKSGD